MQSDLLELKNLGNTSINWLKAIGVNSRSELEQKGAISAYLTIKERGIRVSKVLLYALHGALADIHWSDISDETKQSLLKQAEIVSKEAEPA